ncbi:MAG TPA: hypothetical protein VIM65_04410 [Cyclobacteriaceae bacterium]
MKKNIGIGVLALITILSMMYAYAQKLTASKQRQLAVENMEIAKKERERLLIQINIANEQKAIAEQKADDALKRNKLLEDQLKKLGIKSVRKK